MFLTAVLPYAFLPRIQLKARVTLMTRREASSGCGGPTTTPRWSAGRRLLKSPSDSHPDGTPEGASADGTRNPVLSGVRLRPGGGTRNPKISPHGGFALPQAPPGAPFPMREEGKRDRRCPRRAKQQGGGALAIWAIKPKV